MSTPASPSPLLTPMTIPSFLTTGTLLLTAYFASTFLLPPSTRRKQRICFIWHAYDALSHIILEGWLLYHCFFSYGYISTTTTTAVGGVQTETKLETKLEKAYGCAYGQGFIARLWMEYARADARFAGADPGLVAMELVTVFVGGPVAVFVCWLIKKGDEGGVSFWGAVLATMELYGGFMTFLPEVLTGSPNLNTNLNLNLNPASNPTSNPNLNLTPTLGGNFMLLWIYLVFFNMLYVVFPVWVLEEARRGFKGVFVGGWGGGRGGRAGIKG